MKWCPFYVFPRDLWKVKKAKILLVKWPINEEPITVITRLKMGFKASTVADLGGGCRGCAPPPPTRDDLRFSNTTGILRKKKYVVYWC